jgi:hypothetical protein
MDSIELLRHTIATVAYRGEKATRNAPKHFADFKIGETTRTPTEILAHIGDLFDWALSMAEGETRWREARPRAWNEEVIRFFASVQSFDDYLASESEIQAPLEKLFQGPIADALQHIGQINLLRRLAETPIRGENYFKAEIETGKVGANQSDKRFEFD